MLNFTDNIKSWVSEDEKTEDNIGFSHIAQIDQKNSPDPQLASKDPAIEDEKPSDDQQPQTSNLVKKDSKEKGTKKAKEVPKKKKDEVKKKDPVINPAEQPNPSNVPSPQPSNPVGYQMSVGGGMPNMNMFDP